MNCPILNFLSIWDLGSIFVGSFSIEKIVISLLTTRTKLSQFKYRCIYVLRTIPGSLGCFPVLATTADTMCSSLLYVSGCTLHFSVCERSTDSVTLECRCSASADADERLLKCRQFKLLVLQCENSIAPVLITTRCPCIRTVWWTWIFWPIVQGVTWVFQKRKHIKFSFHCHFD